MSDEPDFPPRRTREQLQSWVADFEREAGHVGHRVARRFSR